MNLREALRIQSPSLALQRAAADEIARLDGLIKDLTATHYTTQAELAQWLSVFGHLGKTADEAGNAIYNNRESVDPQ